MEGLKHQTARSIKWNVIDRLSSQLLYAVTGIILARMVSEDQFGLIGAVLVFQTFASLFIDSGFSYALIQRKHPTRLDYSTIFWFNLFIAVIAYIILFFCVPFIAEWNHDMRIVPLGRVMFLSFILNASAIVQTNRLMKKMEVKMIAVSNAIGLFAGSVVGIWLAFLGMGAWAIVWQTIVLNAVKSLVLWLTSGWYPLARFSIASLKSFFKVGSSMMYSSFLNVLFQVIYSFFIGIKAGMVPLGYYTQADKWSKMGVTGISQVLTSSFLPALSRVQDDASRFLRVAAKMNRFTSYVLMPAMILLAVMATPVFHVLFGTKWDPSIILFQLLLVRGIFTVLSSLYNNYLIALKHTREVMAMETLRDFAALVFLVVSLPYIAVTYDGDIVWGIKILLYGQLAASAITWVVMLVRTSKLIGSNALHFLRDLVPYLFETILIALALWSESLIIANDCVLLVAQGLTAVTLYFGVNAVFNSVIQRELFAYIRNRQINA